MISFWLHIFLQKNERFSQQLNFVSFSPLNTALGYIIGLFSQGGM